MHVKYLAYMANVHNLVNIFVCGTCLAMTCEAYVAAVCVLYVHAKVMGEHIAFW